MEQIYLCIDCNNLSEGGNRCRFNMLIRNVMGTCKRHTDQPKKIQESIQGNRWINRPDWDEFYNKRTGE